jgi:MYXO-CTERM domain-containing protein
MTRTSGRSALFFAVLVGVSGWGTQRVEARPMGEAQACNNCHYKTVGPTVSIAFSPEKPKTGEAVMITVSLKATDPAARRTGIMLSTEDIGRFSITDTTGTKLHNGYTVLHARPRDLMNGTAEFRVRWTAPTRAGVAEFVAWSMTSNETGKPDMYNSGSGTAAIAFGCDAKTYYPDKDKDGYGDRKQPKLSCTPLADHVLDGTDCNDNDPMVNPAAKERCNSIDDNCDGRIDEGLEPGLYYPDEDGDGYASPRARPTFACNDRPGFTNKLGDCDDTNPNVHPGAKEIPGNGIDDNCNGEIDEAPGTIPSMGMGGMSGGQGGSAGSADAGAPVERPVVRRDAAPVADDDRDRDDRFDRAPAGGCAVPGGGAPAAPASLALLGLGLLAAVLRRRRR